MRNRFDKQLRHLNDELIEMGDLIQDAIRNAVSALIGRDAEKAKVIIESDHQIDDKEREIESLCLKLLMQQQPVASDLRIISSALKMVTDMERIGDQASDIAEITITLSQFEYIKKLDHIEQMAKETMVMLMNCLEAFVNRDIDMAHKVIEHDDIVDELFAKVKRELVLLINEDVNNGEQAEDFLMIAKYFERIGDHATNIAEWVIFSISGERK